MQIIIVGPDGAGKTTLANKLAKDSSFKIVKRNQPKTEEEKANMFLSYFEQASKNENVIYDRYAYCELVYGVIMRDTTCISIMQMHELEKELSKNGSLVIFCNSDIETLWKACKERGEDYITDKQTLLKIQARYEHIMLCIKHYIPIVRYDVKNA